MSAAVVSSADITTDAVRYYRFFLACHTLQRSIDRIADALVSLDRLLLASLSPVYLPLQQERIGTAFFEVVAYARARQNLQEAAWRQSRLYGTCEGSRPSDPSTSTAAAGNAAGPPPPPLGHSDTCPYMTWKKQQHGSGSLRPARLSAMSNSKAGGKATGSDAAVPDDPYTDDFMQTLTFEVLRSCPRCVAQIYYQSCWVALALLLQLNIVSLAHSAVAPRTMPDAVLSVSPREGVVHLYYTSQRLAQNAMQLSLLLVVEGKGGGTTTAMKGQGNTPRARKACEGLSHVLYGAPPLSPDITTEGSAPYGVAFRCRVARCVHALLGTSLALLETFPALWPALEVNASLDYADGGGSNDVGSPPATARSTGSDRRTPSPSLLNEASGAKEWLYTEADAVLAVRAALLRVCVLAFTGGLAGTAMGSQELLLLARRITQYEVARRRVKPVAKGGGGTSNKGCIYRIAHAWRNGTIADPTTNGAANVMELAPDGRPLREFEELKQVLVMLAVFLDLVEDRDEQEIGSIANRVARHERLSLAYRVMEDGVGTYLQALRDSSNGSASARARQLLALYWLLHAQLEYYIVSSDEGNESSDGELGPPDYVKEVWRLAVQECDDAREFLGMDLIRDTPGRPWRLLPPQEPDATVTVGQPHTSRRRAAHVLPLALLPMLRIRMWLILCPSIFRGGAPDLLLAQQSAACTKDGDGSSLAAGSLPRMAESKKDAPKGVVPGGRSLGVTAQGPIRSKKEAYLEAQREELHRQQCTTVRRAAVLLRYSPHTASFWWRWRCLLAEDTIPFMDSLPVMASPDAETQRDGAGCGEAKETREGHLRGQILSLLSALGGIVGTSLQPPAMMPSHMAGALQKAYRLQSSPLVGLQELVIACGGQEGDVLTASTSHASSGWCGDDDPAGDTEGGPLEPVCFAEPSVTYHEDAVRRDVHAFARHYLLAPRIPEPHQSRSGAKAQASDRQLQTPRPLSLSKAFQRGEARDILPPLPSGFQPTSSPRRDAATPSKESMSRLARKNLPQVQSPSAVILPTTKGGRPKAVVPVGPLRRRPTSRGENQSIAN